MNRDELLQTVANLHAELSQRTEFDAESREALGVLLRDLERVATPLAQEPSSHSAPRGPASDEPFAERIRAAMAELEIRHPALTGTLSNLAQRLSDMGI